MDKHLHKLLSMKNLVCYSFFFALILSTGVMAQNTVVKETLVYAVKDGKELHMDKYVDNNAAVKGKRPALIYVHGGGFSMGSRVNALQILYCKHFAAQGFVSFCIDYRLGVKQGVQPTQEVVMNAVTMACEDLNDATAFILSKSAEWNIDPGKIIISGGSAGAITCLTAEYDLCSARKYAAHLPADFNYAGIVSHAGCVVVHEDTLTWKKAACPVLFMHGSKDQAVPFYNYALEGNLYAGSNYLHNQFTRLNYPHWLYEEVGADHIIALKPLQYNFSEIDAFIDKLVINSQHSIIHTKWTDEKPDSMGDMQKVVPLYIMGWDKTDEEVNATDKN